MVTIASKPAAPRVDTSLEAPLVLLAACDAVAGAAVPFAAAEPDPLVAFEPDAMAVACVRKVKMWEGSDIWVIPRTRNMSKLF